MGIVSENDDSLFALLAGSSLVGIFVSLFSAVCFAVYMYCFQLEYSIGVEAVGAFLRSHVSDGCKQCFDLVQ